MSKNDDRHRVNELEAELKELEARKQGHFDQAVERGINVTRISL